MSIEKYAKFWERNICDFPEAALKEKMGADMGSIIDGLAELRKILKMIYSDYKVFEVDDDDVEQNYDNLMYTVRFLQSIGKVGSLKNDRNNKIYLHIDKSNFIFKHDKLSKNLLFFNIMPCQNTVFLLNIIKMQ